MTEARARGGAAALLARQPATVPQCCAVKHETLFAQAPAAKRLFRSALSTGDAVVPLTTFARAAIGVLLGQENQLFPFDAGTGRFGFLRISVPELCSRETHTPTRPPTTIAARSRTTGWKQ